MNDKQNEKVILMKTLLDLYEQNELFQNIVVQEYIDKLETKLKELLWLNDIYLLQPTE